MPLLKIQICSWLDIFPFASLCSLSTLLLHLALRPRSLSFLGASAGILALWLRVGCGRWEALAGEWPEREIQGPGHVSPLSLCQHLSGISLCTETPFLSSRTHSHSLLLEACWWSWLPPRLCQCRALDYALQFSSPASLCVCDPLNSPHVHLLPPGTLRDTVKVLLH